MFLCVTCVQLNRDPPVGTILRGSHYQKLHRGVMPQTGYGTIETRDHVDSEIGRHEHLSNDFPLSRCPRHSFILSADTHPPLALLRPTHSVCISCKEMLSKTSPLPMMA